MTDFHRKLQWTRRAALCAVVALALIAGGAVAAAAGESDVKEQIEQQALDAKKEGMRLYGIRWRSVAIPHLEKAAEAGDVESMYYLGEIHRFMDRGMSREAIDWYHRAALGGDPHAMLRLERGMICELADICPEEHDTWVKMALQQELPKAETGDTEAMIALRSIYAVLEQGNTAEQWLRKAAEAGNPHAQDWWARSIQNRSGELPPPLEDVKAAEPWFRKAAEQGYAPAMNNLSKNLRRQERFGEAWTWAQDAADHGHVDSRFSIAWCHLDPTLGEKEGNPFCQVEEDRITGWAMLHAMNEETRAWAPRTLMEQERHLLAEQEIQEAERRAGKWLDQEPPMSKFPPKYGF